MLKSLARRKKSLKSWHRNHWLHSKLLNYFCAVNFDHVWNRLPGTNWWSLAKECARRTLVRRLPLSSRNGLRTSTPAKLHSQGSSSLNELRRPQPPEPTRLVKRSESKSQGSAEANKMPSRCVLFNLYCRNM